MDDGKVTAAEREQCRKGGSELIQAVALLLFTLDAEREGRQPKM